MSHSDEATPDLSKTDGVECAEVKKQMEDCYWLVEYAGAHLISQSVIMSKFSADEYDYMMQHPYNFSYEPQWKGIEFTIMEKMFALTNGDRNLTYFVRNNAGVISPKSVVFCLHFDV
jgi:hypothetical protein